MRSLAAPVLASDAGGQLAEVTWCGGLGRAAEQPHRDAEVLRFVERVVDNPSTNAACVRSPLWEMVRGQFAGLLAGATGGAVLAVRSSAEPAWHGSTIPVALFGVLMGGFFGVLAGFVAGMTLRFLRSVPVALAATAAGVAVAVTVTMALAVLGWTSPSDPWRFPIVVGLLAGGTAAAATPWIRRPPIDATP